MFLRVFLILIVLGVSQAPANAASTNSSGTQTSSLTADQYMRHQIDKVFGQLGDEALGARERERRFRALIRDIFDVRFISKFVLGRYWKRDGETENKRFADLMIELQVTRWAQRFKPKKGQGYFDIGAPRTDESGHHLVPMTLSRANGGGEGIDLLWRLRSVGDSYKVFDIMIEGTSMLIAHRSEYQSFMRRNGGLPALNEKLSEQIEAAKTE